MIVTHVYCFQTTSGETKSAVCQRITQALFPDMAEAEVAETGEKISSKVDGYIPSHIPSLSLSL